MNFSSPSEPAIDLRGVTKRYPRGVVALREMALRVERGEIFGLLGPNGAGKSTLVKILMTVIRPTQAEGTVLGRPLGHRPTLARVGYLPEHHRFPAYLTGRQALHYYAALAGVDRPTRRRRADELLERVGLRDWAAARVSTYSKGMQQRIGLAQALMADPDLVILDEPTDGLDPLGRREIREVLVRLRTEGKTVFINSHLLSEVEQVCDRVAILAAGRVVRHGTIADLTGASRRYEIELSPQVNLEARVRAALPPSGALAGGEPVAWAGGLVQIGTAEAAAVQPVIDALRSAGLVIRALRPVQQSLEDFFVEAVSEGRSPPL